jgi:Na+:H+ antiporter
MDPGVESVGAAVLLLAVIILIAPRLAERVRIPGLVGLIAGGMVIGPYVLGWVSADGLIAELGAIGLLYLMFLAGLGFNLSGFARHRAGAVALGVLAFALPFLLSIVVGMGFLDYSFAAGALVGAMWASNTLLAYPEAQAAGLTRNRAVSIAVSAGVIADIFALTVLAVVTARSALTPEQAATRPSLTIPLWLGIPALAAFTLWVLPRLAGWFFSAVGHTRTQRFVFVLGGMGAGAVVAELAGIEGLVGAFLAGLGMNRLIPSGGPLMGRIEFFGEALLVPAFLVSVGLSIDPAALFNLDTLWLGLLFTAIVLVGKTAAALLVGLPSGLSTAEIGIMSTLSYGHAASTLAISQVAVQLGILDQDVVNAAIVAIVITAVLTSSGTRFFAGRLEAPTATRRPLGTRVLVDARGDEAELESLIEMAGAIATHDDGLVLPFGVASGADRQQAEAQVKRAVDSATRLGMDSEGIVRVGDSLAHDALNLVEERQASLLILRWEGPRFPSDFVLGSELDDIGQQSTVPTVAAHVLGAFQRLVVVVGDTSASWRREDAELAVTVADRIHRAQGTPLVVFTPDGSMERFGAPSDAEIMPYVEGRRSVLQALQAGDLVIVPTAVSRIAATISSPLQSRYLRDISVAVVGGPGRLSVGPGAAPSPLHGTIDQRD